MNNQRKRFITLVLSINILILSCNSMASGFVYSPNNTAFGGNNASATQLLLTKAQSQDTTVDPNKTQPKEPKTAIERFQESLERRILSRIARDIVSNAFSSENDNENNTGTYSTEDFSVDINDDNPDEISVTIVETATGDETKIDIPKF